MIATAPQARKPKILVRSSSSFCNGDLDRFVAVTMLAIWPIWVDWPVATTTSSAEPRVTWVFWNTRLVRSPSGCSSSARVVRSLAIGADSPVSAASWTSSDAEEMMRASAGTRSPASTSRMSPGTSPTASTSSTVPSRRTRAIGTCSWASASTLAIALRSWLVPMITLNSTSSITIAPVAIWSIVKLAMLTISSMMFIGLAICAFAICHVVGGGSVATSFLPYFATRLATSAALSPDAASTPSRETASSTDSEYHRVPSGVGCWVGSSVMVIVVSSMILRSAQECGARVGRARRSRELLAVGAA